MANYIFRTCFSRPEMLYFSLKYEAEARKNSNLDLVTVFCIEYGAPKETHDLVNKFQFPKKVFTRNKKFGMAKNSMEGQKLTVAKVDKFVLLVEEDILFHKSALKFLEDNINIFDDPNTATFRLGHGTIAHGSIESSIEKKDLSLHVSSVPHFASWGGGVSKTFMQHYLTSKTFVYSNDGQHLIVDGVKQGCDGYFSRTCKEQARPWKSYEAYINRYMNIGIYGRHVHQNNRLPKFKSFQEKINWFDERIKEGDLWEYSTFFKNYIPPYFRFFDPLLEE